MSKATNIIRWILTNQQDRIKLIFAFLIGLLFPVTAWIISAVQQQTTNIFTLHLHNPVLFLLDCLPICSVIAMFWFVLTRYKELARFEAELKEKEYRINRNATLAKLIGEGNFSAEVDDMNANDVLTQSLLRMRENLLNTSHKEAEQTWIAKGRDQISNILRQHTNLEDLAFDTIKNLIEYINAVQGAFYYLDEQEEELINIATYAYNRKKYINRHFKVGEGLVGQAAYEMDTIYRTEIPDYYVTISSGLLGDKKPCSLLIVPLVSDEKLQGVIEFASLEESIPAIKIEFIEQLSGIIGQTVFNLKVNTRTERLLTDAQKMTEELRENEEELRQNAEEMRATHEELEKMNANLQQKIKEVENAQKRMHSLLENASEVIAIHDRNQRLVWISPSVINIYGFAVDEMIEGKDADRMTSKAQRDFVYLFEQLLANPTQAVSIQYTYMRKDNQKIHIESTGRNFLDDPAIQGIVINSQDITARKKAELEERMKSKMQALSENSLDMIVRIGLSGKFFYMNPIFEKLTGVPKDSINLGLSEVNLNQAIIDIFKNIIDQIRTTVEKFNTEVEFPTIAGELRIMSIDAIPEFNEEKELETILVVSHDITEQKNIEREIKEKNHAVSESINYAYRIQTAILPDMKLIQEKLPKSFMFYKPRDVVSGDFPWFFTRNDIVYIAAVDCTGHGVPGALLSFVGYFLLNNIADHAEGLNAGQICDRLHLGVRATLKQDREDANARDGMDIAFCKIDFKNKTLQYAGAHRPLYQLRGKEVTEYKGNRKAIGGIPHLKKEEEDFTNYEIPIQEGDKFFFFSDGMPDQVGGSDRTKYQARRIREALAEYNDYTINAFYAYFKKDFNKWKGENKQIDDVLLIGIEI